MIPGRQSDAMDCFRIFYACLGGALQESCWVNPPDEMLRYPVDIEDGVHMSLCQLLEIVEPAGPLRIGSPPETLLLNVLPYNTLNETEADWVTVVISGWDDLVDMTRFCTPGAAFTQYVVKAVMYHVNPGVGSTNLRCEHYVTYIKQRSSGTSPTTLLSLPC